METTVGAQRRGNIHVRQGISREAFIALRRAKDARLPAPKLIIPSLQVNVRAGMFPSPEADGSVYLKIPSAGVFRSRRAGARGSVVVQEAFVGDEAEEAVEESRPCPEIA